ncbi:MAG: M24 family metallopeptidase, partial [Coriobacteriia bacterium]|nr:M24 family metallopeptidase [Coriobacteriia bacterium]
QEITDRGFEHICGYLRPGVTEREIAIELESFMRREGSEGVAFPSIVASGPNSALPHAHATSRAIESGDFVTMDFGARAGGYCADMTRTLVLGTASSRQREVYEAVLAAQLAGIEAVQPDRAGKDIDAAARAVLIDAGLGEYFVHGLGHGVGLEVHELPGVGMFSEEPVRLGSVVTMEPGVYIESFGGVRIEDSVVVQDDGARVLPQSPKTLIEL